MNMHLNISGDVLRTKKSNWISPSCYSNNLNISHLRTLCRLFDFVYNQVYMCIDMLQPHWNRQTAQGYRCAFRQYIHLRLMYRIQKTSMRRKKQLRSPYFCFLTFNLSRLPAILIIKPCYINIIDHHTEKRCTGTHAVHGRTHGR